MISGLGIDVREALRRLTFSCALLAAAVPLSDCADPGGPSLVTLGVDVDPSVARFGSNPPPARIADICVRLPVLLGSRVEKRQGVETDLSVEIKATRDGAEVTFPGATNDDTSRSYSFGQLQIGIDETVAVSTDYADLEATIATNCTNP